MISKFSVKAVNSEEDPMLNYFHIPFAPEIICNILQNIVKLNSLFTDMDILIFDKIGGQGKHKLISITLRINKGCIYE